MFETLGIDHTKMSVQVTVAVQKPEEVDCDALARNLPRGCAVVTAVHGGLNVANPDSGNVIVIANAAVEAFLDAEVLPK